MILDNETDTCVRTKRLCIKNLLYSTPQPCSRSMKTPTLKSPISQLPVELLSRVFLLGFSDRQNSRKSNGQNFEVVVSHVNAYWRSVAIRETRKLWTSIHFSDVTHMDRAKTYLARSGCMLIDVVIDTESLEDHTPGRTLFRDEFHPVFKIVTPHIYRWRSFVLKLRDHQCKTSTIAELSTCGPAPSLTHLQLWHVESSTAGAENFWMSTVRPPVIVFDGQLPSLISLSLIGVNIPWASSHSPFVKDLQSLELALHCENVRPTYDEWESMLRRCSALEKLSLHYSGPRMSPGWSEDPICLPCLTDLSIADLDPDHLCCVFQRLRVPRVKRLRLELPDQNYTPFLDVVRRSKSKVFSQVDILRVDSLECSKEAWRGFLLSTPLVTTLEVDFRRVPSGFCEVLFHVEESRPGAGEPKQTVILPRLTCLRVSGISGSFLSRFHRFRKRLGMPVDRYWVNENCRDKEMENLFPDRKIVYFEDEEYEADTEEERQDCCCWHP